MINRTCVLCGSSDLSRIYANLLACGACGVIFEDIDLGLVDAAVLYGPDYYRGSAYSDYAGEAPVRTAVFREKLALVREHLPPRGRVLDAGCAVGCFMEVLAESGFEPYGIDVSSFAAGLAQDAGIGPVSCGDIGETGFPDGYFAAVTMWDILEHLPDPAAALREAHRVLEPGGSLIVETLNIGSLCARVMRGGWPLHAPPYHLCYYTVGSLQNLLVSCGFRPGRAVPVSVHVPWRGDRGKLLFYRNPLLRLLPASIAADVVLCNAVREQ